MKTTLEVTKELLLTGKHITYRDLEAHTEIRSTRLAPRILDLRKQGWNIKSRSVPGKGNLAEYWLEHEEIERIKNAQYMPISKQIETDEQSAEVDTNIAVGGLEMAQEEFYEQLGLGLLGTSNY